MMSLRGAKILAAAASLSGVFFLSGCPNPPPPPDMAGTPDMSMLPDDMAMSPVDMATGGCDPVSGMCDMSMPPQPDMARPDGGSPGDMATVADMATTGDMARPDGGSPGDMGMGGAGDIGAPCTADTDCKKGPTPSCWKSNVLNNSMNPATPGGYCSSECTSDAACGAGARCVSLGMKSYCLAGCNSATICRHPGYACSYYDTAGVCFPDTIYNCNPKTAACTEAGTGKMGGCIRQAYEDKGTCAASCTAGTGTCASVGTTKRQCVYLDTTKSPPNDAWKGLICLESPATAVMPGGACTYVNDCTDGYQCDGASSTCRQICVKGGTPACTMGMCTDAFGTAATGPGICR